MTSKLSLYLGIFAIFIHAPWVQAHNPTLSEPSLPWGVAEDSYIDKNYFYPATNQGKVDSYQAKALTTIKNIPFATTFHFVHFKGLSQISYIADLNNEPFYDKCESLQKEISNQYGQRTNEVHITDQNTNNYTEVIWTSKMDRIVRLFCYNNNQHNYVTVSMYPRWMVLDCYLHAQDDTAKDRKIKRAFFYFDKVNEDIRFFNNSTVTLPFKSTYTFSRIEFSHNNPHDRTTIDLNSGVIMSKFVNEDGHEQLLVGNCKKQ